MLRPSRSRLSRVSGFRSGVAQLLELPVKHGADEDHLALTGESCVQPRPRRVALADLEVEQLLVARRHHAEAGGIGSDAVVAGLARIGIDDHDRRERAEGVEQIADRVAPPRATLYVEPASVATDGDEAPAVLLEVDARNVCGRNGEQRGHRFRARAAAAQSDLAEPAIGE